MSFCQCVSSSRIVATNIAAGGGAAGGAAGSRCSRGAACQQMIQHARTCSTVTAFYGPSRSIGSSTINFAKHNINTRRFVMTQRSATKHHDGLLNASRRRLRPSWTPFYNGYFASSSKMGRHFASSSLNEENESGSDDTTTNKAKRSTKKTTKKTTKMKINENWQKDFNAERLSKAFDELAKQDGFDESTAFFDNVSPTKKQQKIITNKNFDDDDINAIDQFWDDDLEIQDDDEDDDDVYFLDDDDIAYDKDDEDIIDLEDDDDDDDDDNEQYDEDDEDSSSMDDRIAQAKREASQSKFSVPKELDELVSSGDAHDELRRLGFQTERNPYGRDETPRNDLMIQVQQTPMQCSACGADFQMSNIQKPGYLPPAKFAIQQELQLKYENAKRAESGDWTADDEVEWLLKNSEDDGTIDPSKVNDNIETDEVTQTSEEEGDEDDDILDAEVKKEKKKKKDKPIICQRCHGLQNFGTVDTKLRPGWTDEPLLSQESFQNLLQPLKEKDVVIVALVDLFDFSGSVLPQLDSIAGKHNPVLLVANKADLLPSKMGPQRAQQWVKRELEYLGIKCINNRGSAIRLVSCKTGFGIGGLLAKARELAYERKRSEIYLVGAANAGKSTLINRILYAQEKRQLDKQGKKKLISKRKRAGKANQFKGSITTSPLPGTTLKFIKVDIGDGLSLYDTPGLLVPGTVTQALTPEELKMVVPKKEVEPITFRVPSGKCVLIGGMAKVEVIEDSKPYLLTFFVSNDIKLHVTDSTKADDFITNHIGELLTPPLSLESYKSLGPFESRVVEVEGFGWKEASADIALRGLGWIAVTGPGLCKLRITIPQCLSINVRPPLMPFDALESAAKYTGGRATRKSTKTKAGKRRGGVGRR